jgi:hypothetical protein
MTQNGLGNIIGKIFTYVFIWSPRLLNRSNLYVEGANTKILETHFGKYCDKKVIGQKLANLLVKYTSSRKMTKCYVCILS